MTTTQDAVCVRLRKSILGWMLIPGSGDSKEALDLLYGTDYHKLSNSGRAFCRGESIAEALAYVKKVCRVLKVKVSACGNRQSPTLRLWLPKQKVVVHPIILYVDLKWSAWSEDQSIWERYAPGAWSRMKLAWQGVDSPVTICTSPRKEIRYGAITISKGRAEGYFRTEWDDAEILAKTLGAVCDEAFEDSLPYSTIGESVGLDWDVEVSARSFAKLMHRIDCEESKLLESDEQYWKSLEEVYTTKSVS